MNKTGNKRRGRPTGSYKFTGEDREKIVTALKQNDGGNGVNVRQVCRLLTSKNGVVGITKVERELAVQRAALGFTKPVKITPATLHTIAKTEGVKVRDCRGRPCKVAPVETAPVEAPALAA